MAGTPGSTNPQSYRSISTGLREARMYSYIDFSPLVRMARAGMGISQARLAHLCKLSEATIRRLEQRRQTRGSSESLERVLEFFEQHEYEFVVSDADGMQAVRFPLAVPA